MDSVTRYSYCHPVPRTALADAVLGLEFCFISQFSGAATVLGDQAFNNSVFTDFLRSPDI